MSNNTIKQCSTIKEHGIFKKKMSYAVVHDFEASCLVLFVVALVRWCYSLNVEWGIFLFVGEDLFLVV